MPVLIIDRGRHGFRQSGLAATSSMGAWLRVTQLLTVLAKDSTLHLL